MEQKKGQWMVTNSRTVYTNPWVTLIEDDVIQPDGKPGIYTRVTQPGGSSIIAMDENLNVYLAKEYRYPLERVMLEAVGGGTDGNETRLETAQRELKEEAGLTARKWTPLGVIDSMTALLDSPNHIYLAQELTQGEPALEGTETLEIVTMPFEKALSLVWEGEITHAATVVALLKIERLLKEVQDNVNPSHS